MGDRGGWRQTVEGDFLLPVGGLTFDVEVRAGLTPEKNPASDAVPPLPESVVAVAWQAGGAVCVAKPADLPAAVPAMAAPSPRPEFVRSRLMGNTRPGAYSFQSVPLLDETTGRLRDSQVAAEASAVEEGSIRTFASESSAARPVVMQEPRVGNRVVTLLGMDLLKPENQIFAPAPPATGTPPPFDLRTRPARSVLDGILRGRPTCIFRSRPSGGDRSGAAGGGIRGVASGQRR